MHLPSGKKYPVVLIVDDQKSYAQRMITRLLGRGFREENLYHERNAQTAKEFIEHAQPGQIIGVLSDQVNGTISKTTGVEVIKAARQYNPNMLTLLVSSEDRIQEPEFIAAGFEENDFSRKFYHKRLAVFFLNPIRDEASKTPGLLQEIPTAVHYFGMEATIFKTLLRDIDDIAYSVFGTQAFDNLRDRFPEAVKAFDDALLNLSSPIDVVPAVDELRNKVDRQKLENAQMPIFQLREFISEINYYLDGIQELVGDGKFSPADKAKQLESQDKNRFEQDYNRFKRLAQKLDRIDLAAFREHATLVRGSEQEASNLVHGVIGVRDAVSESLQSFSQTMTKMAKYYRETPEVAPQSTVGWAMEEGLKFLRSFIGRGANVAVSGMPKAKSDTSSGPGSR